MQIPILAFLFRLKSPHLPKSGGLNLYGTGVFAGRYFSTLSAL